MEIKFTGQKWKVGNSEVVSIPKSIAKLLAKDTDYEFLIKEVDNGQGTP